MAGIKEISTEMLREWLENGQPVSVLDIRPMSERAEWHIPGSVHITAYDRLKAGDADALAGLYLDKTIPVVTVCAGGKTSLLAAEILDQQGYDAWSLQGGMKAWSLAWNTATAAFDGFEGVQFRRTGKGCLSYAIVSDREVLIVDASLETEVYEQFLKARNLVLKYVAETHIHADHLSRSKQLAEATGVPLYLPTPNKVAFDFQPLENQAVLQIGSVAVQVLSTPGHTLESISFLVGSQALLTGDTLFLNGVGRPDLKTDPEEARQRAKLLHRSLSDLSRLDDSMQVLPAHTNQPVPFDQKMISASLKKVKDRLPMLQMNEDDFAENLLGKIPPTPANYLAIIKLNNSGRLELVDPTEMEAGANRCAIS